MSEINNVEQIFSNEPEKGTVRQPQLRALTERVHTVAFWFLVVFLLGACAGVGVAFKYHSSQIEKSTRLGSFIHDGVVYEVTPKAQK